PLTLSFQEDPHFSPFLFRALHLCLEEARHRGQLLFNITLLYRPRSLLSTRRTRYKRIRSRFDCDTTAPMKKIPTSLLSVLTVLFSLQLLVTCAGVALEARGPASLTLIHGEIDARSVHLGSSVNGPTDADASLFSRDFLERGAEDNNARSQPNKMIKRACQASEKNCITKSSLDCKNHPWAFGCKSTDFGGFNHDGTPPSFKKPPTVSPNPPYKTPPSVKTPPPPGGPSYGEPNGNCGNCPYGYVWLGWSCVAWTPCVQGQCPPCTDGCGNCLLDLCFDHLMPPFCTGEQCGKDPLVNPYPKCNPGDKQCICALYKQCDTGGGGGGGGSSGKNPGCDEPWCQKCPNPRKKPTRPCPTIGEQDCAEADSSCVFTDDKSYVIDAENLIGCTETDSEGHGRVFLRGATTGRCKFSGGPLTVVCPNTDSQLYVLLDPDMDKSKNEYKKAGNKKVQAYWTSNEASKTQDKFSTVGSKKGTDLHVHCT
ncbi:hypothetical protein FA10DRAFT_295199, partial [Acaromyces ingoldii]